MHSLFVTLSHCHLVLIWTVVNMSMTWITHYFSLKHCQQHCMPLNSSGCSSRRSWGLFASWILWVLCRTNKDQQVRTRINIASQSPFSQALTATLHVFLQQFNSRMIISRDSGVAARVRVGEAAPRVRVYPGFETSNCNHWCFLFYIARMWQEVPTICLSSASNTSMIQDDAFNDIQRSLPSTAVVECK